MAGTRDRTDGKEIWRQALELVGEERFAAVGTVFPGSSWDAYQTAYFEGRRAGVNEVLVISPKQERPLEERKAQERRPNRGSSNGSEWKSEIFGD